MIHTSYVFPAGAGVERVEHEHGRALVADDEPAVACRRARPSVRWVGQDGGGGALLLERQARVVEIRRHGEPPDAGRDRRACSEGSTHGEDRHDTSAPLDVERDDVLALCAGGIDDPVAKLGARRRAGCGRRQRGGDVGERAQLLAGLLGGLQELLRACAVGLVEGVERVAGDQLVSLGVHDPSDSASSSTSRSRASPANILLLIVPSGTPSRSASSDCE